MTFVAPNNTPVPEQEHIPLLEGERLAHWVSDLLWTASASTPRSLQPEIGPSELGLACSRQIAFRLAGSVPVNMTTDPLASMVGSAMHQHLAEIFAALHPPGRFLVEHPVAYREVRGTLDLYDRRTRTVVDWKFPKLAKARRVRSGGPPRHYLWQIQTYAAGLELQGEQPAHAAVVYIPVDGTLADIFAWVVPVERAQADEAVERLETVRELTTAKRPGGVPKQPSRLCPWCPYYRKGWLGDADAACPGEDNA